MNNPDLGKSPAFPKKQIVTFENIYVGAKVIDESGDSGTVLDCSDAHNILIGYAEGSGFYCLSPKCKDNDCGNLLFDAGALIAELSKDAV